jgi:uncharacterized protein YjbI with pentapeptide repeats
MAATTTNPWSFDDMIVYALAAFPQRAKSVLNRVRDAPDAELLAGDELICTRVLHVMSEHEDVSTIDQAVRTLFGDQIAVIEHECLMLEMGHKGRIGAREGADIAFELPRPIRVRLAARAFARSLASCPSKPSRHVISALKAGLSRELIRATASEVRAEHVREGLARAANKPATACAAASLLARVDPKWRPTRCRDLRHADLEAVYWVGAELRKTNFSCANLDRAVLDEADLRSSDLVSTHLGYASLARARLDRANCTFLKANHASFSQARLQSTNLTGAWLQGSSLTSARLPGAILEDAHLDGADLSGSECWLARFSGASLKEANLTGAFLRESSLPRADFRTTVLDRINLERANLTAANLEGVAASDVSLSRALLTRALLTAASLPRANLKHANLRGAGLAHVELEDADLRSVDFTHASFHLGSSRSGLVGSVIAGEGSRTGFYTDDYGDKCFKDPEAIRKASLCGADLRGAIVEDCDFYLVDLRHARYHPSAAEHFKRCGAIL